jgi:predicted outer membrane protein
MISLVMAGACESGDGDTRTPAASTNASSSATVDSAGGEVASDSSTAVAGRWLSDANALALFTAMNSAQLAAANVALQGWHSDTVRAFAASVAQTHAALQHSADSLGASLAITPITPALAQEVSATMQAQIDSIRGMRGGELDRAFLEQQVHGQGLMSSYAGQLSGVAEHPELQAFLASAAGKVGSEATAANALQRAFVTADSLTAAAAADSAAKRAARRKH